MEQFEKDVNKDAIIVHASMHKEMIGIVLQTYDITMEILSERCKWLKEQDNEYLDKVLDKVLAMELSIGMFENSINKLVTVRAEV